MSVRVRVRVSQAGSRRSWFRSKNRSVGGSGGATHERGGGWRQFRRISARGLKRRFSTLVALF